MSGQGSSTQDDWKGIEDPSERRRAQNRIAQRRHRDKTRKEDEERMMIAQNQQAAGGSYTTADPRELEKNQNPSGLPWGSYALKRPSETTQGQAGQSSQQTSREGSIGQSSYYSGGSSRR